MAIFSNADGTPINLSGTTVTLDGAPAAVTITDAAAGKVSVVLVAAITSAILQRTRVRFRRVVQGGDTALEPWFWLSPE